jgi:hypothetical protein
MSFNEMFSNEINTISNLKNDHRLNMIFKGKERCKCNCGGKYTYANRYQHYRSQRHVAYFSDPIIDNQTMDEMFDDDDVILTNLLNSFDNDKIQN